MHKKFLTSVFALLGGVALVGSGYSAFTFIDSQQEQSINGSVEVSGLFDGMNLAVNKGDASGEFSTFTLNLDQGAPNSMEVNEGVTINGKPTENVDLKVSFAHSDGLQDILDTHNVKLTWNVELQGKVTTYVRLSSNPTGEATIDAVGDLDGGSYTFNDVALSFQYVEGKKPADSSAVQDLSSAFESADDTTLVFTVKCDFVKK